MTAAIAATHTHICPEVLVPDTYQQDQDHCLLCSKSCPVLAQNIIFWVKTGSPAIFLLGLPLCPGCYTATKPVYSRSSPVIEAETVPQVLEALRRYEKPEEEPSFLRLGGAGTEHSVYPYINYFSGHKNMRCDVCQAEATEFCQKIYIGHYRPKRRYEEDPDIVLFHFELCQSCYEKTSDMKEGPARFDWDVIDCLEQRIKQVK